MDRIAAVGTLCLLSAVAGYAVGTVQPYPGRELALVGMMVGLSLLFVGDAT
ncbi:hypothetical protein [Halosegnis sp.]|uniref:hypothetical protein n=1 Tax=Halosegnis sp. TaxID=2864959 RepID=UPI0035D437DD